MPDETNVKQIVQHVRCYIEEPREPAGFGELAAELGKNGKPANRKRGERQAPDSNGRRNTLKEELR
jgi:hypothetical protein